MEKIKDYVKNIDLDMIMDPEILRNVYKEIKGHENYLIRNIETSHQMESIIKMSTLEQLVSFIKKLKLKELFLQKLGSRVLETIFETLYMLIAKEKKLNVGNFKYVIEIISKEINFNFKKFMFDRNATHIMRKYFYLIYGDYAEDKGKLFDKVCYREKIYKILEEDVPVEGLITITQYLQIKHSKRIVRSIVRKYLTDDNLKNPCFSFVFEEIIKIADNKTLEIIFDVVKDNWKDFCSHKCSNYVIATLVKAHPKEIDFYYENIEPETINSNIVLRILNMLLVKKDKRVSYLLKSYYNITEEDDVFCKLLLNTTETPDTKYVDVICLMMDRNMFNTNESFVEQFKPNWINHKFGIKLTKAFLQGDFGDKLKIKFTKKIKFSEALKNKKEGRIICDLITSFKKVNRKKILL